MTCPFCGSEPRVYVPAVSHVERVVCKTAGCPASYGGVYANVWNRRAYTSALLARPVDENQDSESSGTIVQPGATAGLRTGLGAPVGSNAPDSSIVPSASSPTNERVERLAALCHEMWSGWMEHLFGVGYAEAGELVIPQWATERWRRQMMTDYADLPDDEKVSDRDEAKRIIRAEELGRSSHKGEV